MNWLLVAAVVAYGIWILSMIYHRRDVKDERGKIVILKSNNFAYWVVLLCMSVIEIINRFIHPLSQNQLIIVMAVVILGGLTSSALSMFVYNKLQ